MVKKSNQSASGTCYQGTLSEYTFSELVKIFGEPSSWATSDGKVQAEWVLDTPHGVATIYDWKEDVMLDHVSEWHVGGFNNDVVEDLQTFISENRYV